MVVPVAVLLLAESDESGRRLFLELERVGYRCELSRVATADDLRRELTARPWQVVIAEESSDNGSGREALELARKLAPQLPRVLLIETLNEELSREFSQAGMPELLPQGLPGLVGPTMARALDQYALHQQLADREADLQRTRKLDSVGSLAGTMAHELNNLLTPILIAAELLSEDAKEGDKPLLDGLSAGGRRAADAVKSLQSFIWSRSAEFHNIRLAELLEELERLMQFTLPKTIKRQVSTAADLRPVLGDPSSLVQVLMSLIANAREAMPEGGKLTVSAENVELSPRDLADTLEHAAGPYVCLEVKDSGRGMEPETLARAGEPFFTTKAPDRGLGLGLASSQAILVRHGGWMKLKSEVGQGTRVTMYLPALATSDDVAPTPLGRGHESRV